MQIVYSLRCIPLSAMVDLHPTQCALLAIDRKWISSLIFLNFISFLSAARSTRSILKHCIPGLSPFSNYISGLSWILQHVIGTNETLIKLNRLIKRRDIFRIRAVLHSELFRRNTDRISTIVLPVYSRLRARKVLVMIRLRFGQYMHA